LQIERTQHGIRVYSATSSAYINLVDNHIYMREFVLLSVS